MTSLFVELARSTLGVLLVAYTIVAIGHFVLQLRYAHKTYRRQSPPQFAANYPGVDVAVDILVPVYNEVPELLDACLASAIGQDHDGPIQLIVVDDGSPNRADLDAIYDRYEELGARVVRSPRNVGKRRAQALGLRLATGEILVTLDSDSVLKSDAVRMLTRQFSHPEIGAATGFVDVANRRANLLTRIQRVRYWMAFNQERAAQTWFRTVMCCSGPLAAYRRSIVESVKEAYLAQMYGGVECTYGDDRHLTNLVLAQGYDTVYDSGAIAWTNVPTSLNGFIRQQLRWNKSFYRELIWTSTYIANRPWYSRFDVACQVAMPVMLTVTAGSALILGVLSSPLYLLRYVAFIALAAALRSTYAVLRERDLRFYLFVVYGYISAFLLVSVRLRALATLTDARWGTRGGAVVSRAGAAMAGLMASLEPLRVAPQATTWTEPPRARAWRGGSARLDGAWRAGLRTRMMAHPPDGPEGAAPIIRANLVSGAADVAFEMAPGWEISPPDPTAKPALAAAAVGRTRTPRYVSPLPPGHNLFPLGEWRIGPQCRHAVAMAGSQFCGACGATAGPVFDAAPKPVRALHERLAARAQRHSVQWRTAAELVAAKPEPPATTARSKSRPNPAATKPKQAATKPRANSRATSASRPRRPEKPAKTKTKTTTAATPTRSLSKEKAAATTPPRRSPTEASPAVKASKTTAKPPKATAKPPKATAKPSKPTAKPSKPTAEISRTTSSPKKLTTPRNRAVDAPAGPSRKQPSKMAARHTKKNAAESRKPPVKRRSEPPAGHRDADRLRT
ncbi:MAG TPA: glycosyltransferase [Candidatus Limnocylindrales bacterium]|nr:glycosyltransferase [Candidatus Limnocylindrales bacterium]